MSRDVWYKKVQSKGDRIIEVLFELMEHRNPLVQLGAVKVLANKLVPDLKAIELSGGDNGQPFVIKLLDIDGIRNKLSGNAPAPDSGNSPAGEV